MTVQRPAPAPADPDVGRPVRALVVDRRFGPFFWGSLISNTGTWLQSMSAVLLVFEITGSATAVGGVAVAQYTGYVLLAPVAGQLADRFDRRRLLFVTQSAGLCGAAWLVLVVSDGEFGVLPLYVGVAVTGCAQALSVPLFHALVPSLVPVADLPGAVALQSLTYNFSRAVGPALGATTLVTAGPVVTFSANAASYVAMLAGLVWSRPRTRPVRRRERGVGSVVKYLRGNRSVAARLLVVGAVGFSVDAINTLSPPVVAKIGASDASVGVLVSAFGVGGAVMLLLSVPVIRRLGTGTAAAIGLSVLAAALVVFGTAPGLTAVAVVLVLGGAGFVLGQTALTTSIQQTVPEGVRGRVLALWAVLFLGIRPLAAVVNGGLADLAGAGVAVLVPAGLLAIGLVAVGPRRPRQQEFDRETTVSDNYVADDNRIDTDVQLRLRGIGKQFRQTRSRKRGRGSAARPAAPPGPVLADVNFEVHKQEFVAVIGPSGCGKTTLIKIIHGLLPAEHGVVELNGKPVTKPTNGAGLVFQHAGLLPWRTAQKNVEFGLETKGVPRRERGRVAEEALALVGLTGFEDYYPHQLSGGMQQRVGLARALARGPDVLLMDEPFGALDAQTRERMQEELLKINELTKKTVVFVTHDLDEAVYLADRVVVLAARPGRVREIIDINLPRPRPPAADTKSMAEFVDKRRLIWSLINTPADLADPADPVDTVTGART